MIKTNLQIPQLVVSHPELNWNQKAVLSLIIYHQQTQNQHRFSMKDKEIASILGMKVGSVSTIIGQLFELGITDKELESTQPQKGIKNKNIRYIWMESLDIWLNGSQLPIIRPRTQEELEERTKKQFKAVDGSKSSDIDLNIIYNYEDLNRTSSQFDLAIEQYQGEEPTVIHKIKISFEGEVEEVEAFEYKDENGTNKLMMLEIFRTMIKFYKKHPIS